MTIEVENILVVLLGLLLMFVYICIGAFFAWIIGMDEVSLAYVGVLFFWPAIGFAAYAAIFLGWMLAMIVLGGIVGIFR